MDLLHKDYRDTDQSEFVLNGLCYPIAEALYYACPGQFTPWRILWEDGGSHWFLKAQDGAIVDLVSYPELLCHPDDYDTEQRVGFLSSPRIVLALPGPAGAGRAGDPAATTGDRRG